MLRFKGTFDLRTTGSYPQISIPSFSGKYHSKMITQLLLMLLAWNPIRQYTAAFGQKIAEELHSLIKYTPRVNDRDSLQNRDAMDIWSSWDWGDLWPMADMAEFVKYLYGAKTVSIPAEWKPLLPTEL